MKTRGLEARRDDAVEPISTNVLKSYFQWLSRPFLYIAEIAWSTLLDVLRFFARTAQFRRAISPNKIAQPDYNLEDPKFKQHRFGGGPF